MSDQQFLGGDRWGQALLVTVLGLALSACQTQLGEGGSKASGSGGAAGADKEAAELEKCSRPVGTAALITSERSQHAKADLPSPVRVMKLIMQQSGCFKVVARGGAVGGALEREREMSEEGSLQSDSNMGEAQMKAADFVLKPAVLFKDPDAGGGGAVLGSLLGPVGALVGGGLQKKEAQTLLTLVNVRTSVQEAVAEGSAAKYDFAGVFGAIGGGVAGGIGAYESTDIGKIVTAALLDAHNKLVTQVEATTAADEREPVAKWKTAARLNLRAGPSQDAPVVTTLPEGAEVRPIGDEDGNWWEVKAEGEQGWVSKNYLTEVN